MSPSDVTQLLYKQLNYRSERQKVISANIANIDTPNYKTKDIKFKDELDRANETEELKLAVTNPNHFQIEPLPKKTDMKVYEVEGLDEQNDGNNVNLDTQMSQMAENSVLFSAIQNSVKKDSAWFKAVIDASSKN